LERVYKQLKKRQVRRQAMSAVQVIASGVAMTELALYHQVDKRLGKARAFNNPL
jgi:hypothetical protein